MHDQPRFEPLEKNDFFADGRSSRLQPAGTIARGELREDEHLYTGFEGEELAETFPFPITRAAIERGRNRFDIMCSPCHGRLGDGDGMIARRGLRHPPSFHEERLRNMPPGHYFDVMTRGIGAMLDFSDRLSVHDRWHVAAYIRALQLSRQSDLSDLPANIQEEFRGAVER
jgi:cytochrome c